MTKIVWNDYGQRFYESSLDRGVIHLMRYAVPWNGLISVDEKMDGSSLENFYNDNVISYINRIPGEFTAQISAYTYPKELDEFDGRLPLAQGVFADGQFIRGTFGLSYRTKIGNDTIGMDAAYKLHLIYNVVLLGGDIKRQTMGSNVDATTFTWDIRGIPPQSTKIKPTAHLVIDSRQVSPSVLRDFEELLYGTDLADAGALPDIDTVFKYFNTNFTFEVWDKGNGLYGVRGGTKELNYTDGAATFGILWDPPSDGSVVTMTTTT